MERTRTNKSLQAMIFICLMLVPLCAFAQVSPVIGNFSVSPDILNDGAASANICVENITPDIGIVRVWAAVMPPGSETLLPADPMTYSPSIDLDPAEGASCKYQKLYTGFSNFGKYRVVVYAEDENGNISAPAIANLDQFLGTDVYEGEDVYEDDTFEHAKPIGVNEEIQRHNFDKAGDEDWIKFYGLPGWKYQIEAMNVGQRSDVVFELYGHDPDNVSSLKSLLPEAVDDLGNKGSELLIWDCTAYGFYYVKYSEAENKYGISTGYDIQISTPDAPADVSIKLPTFRILDNPFKKPILNLIITVLSGSITIAENPDEEGAYNPAANKYPKYPTVATVSISAPGYQKRDAVPIDIEMLYQDLVLLMEPESDDNTQSGGGNITESLRLSVTVEGSANLAVYDAADNECSKDGCYIPEAVFGYKSGVQTVSLMPPGENAYRIVLQGAETGFADLTVIKYLGDNQIFSDKKNLAIAAHQTLKSEWAFSFDSFEEPAVPVSPEGKPLVYDFDGDGKIDDSDIGRIASRWNKAKDDTGYDPFYDLDGDGSVTVKDIMKVSAEMTQP